MSLKQMFGEAARFLAFKHLPSVHRHLVSIEKKKLLQLHSFHFSLVGTPVSQQSALPGWLCVGTQAVLWDEDSRGSRPSISSRRNGELLLGVTDMSLLHLLVG